MAEKGFHVLLSIEADGTLVHSPLNVHVCVTTVVSFSTDDAYHFIMFFVVLTLRASIFVTFLYCDFVNKFFLSPVNLNN